MPSPVIPRSKSVPDITSPDSPTDVYASSKSVRTTRSTGSPIITWPKKLGDLVKGKAPKSDLTEEGLKEFNRRNEIIVEKMDTSSPYYKGLTDFTLIINKEKLSELSPERESHAATYISSGNKSNLGVRVHEWSSWLALRKHEKGHCSSSSSWNKSSCWTPSSHDTHFMNPSSSLLKDTDNGVVQTRIRSKPARTESESEMKKVVFSSIKRKDTALSTMEKPLGERDSEIPSEQIMPESLPYQTELIMPESLPYPTESAIAGPNKLGDIAKGKAAKSDLTEALQEFNRRNATVTEKTATNSPYYKGLTDFTLIINKEKQLEFPGREGHRSSYISSGNMPESLPYPTPESLSYATEPTMPPMTQMLSPPSKSICNESSIAPLNESHAVPAPIVQASQPKIPAAAGVEYEKPDIKTTENEEDKSDMNVERFQEFNRRNAVIGEKTDTSSPYYKGLTDFTLIINKEKLLELNPGQEGHRSSYISSGNMPESLPYPTPESLSYATEMTMPLMTQMLLPPSKSICNESSRAPPNESHAVPASVVQASQPKIPTAAGVEYEKSEIKTTENEKVYVWADKSDINVERFQEFNRRNAVIGEKTDTSSPYYKGLTDFTLIINKEKLLELNPGQEGNRSSYISSGNMPESLPYPTPESLSYATEMTMPPMTQMLLPPSKSICNESSLAPPTESHSVPAPVVQAPQPKIPAATGVEYDKTEIETTENEKVYVWADKSDINVERFQEFNRRNAVIGEKTDTSSPYYKGLTDFTLIINKEKLLELNPGQEGNRSSYISSSNMPESLPYPTPESLSYATEMTMPPMTQMLLPPSKSICNESSRAPPNESHAVPASVVQAPQPKIPAATGVEYDKTEIETTENEKVYVWADKSDINVERFQEFNRRNAVIGEKTDTSSPYYKGLTDFTLIINKEKLLELNSGRDGHTSSYISSGNMPESLPYLTPESLSYPTELIMPPVSQMLWPPSTPFYNESSLAPPTESHSVPAPVVQAPQPKIPAATGVEYEKTEIKTTENEKVYVWADKSDITLERLQEFNRRNAVIGEKTATSSPYYKGLTDFTLIINKEKLLELNSGREGHTSSYINSGSMPESLPYPTPESLSYPTELIMPPTTQMLSTPSTPICNESSIAPPNESHAVPAPVVQAPQQKIPATTGVEYDKPEIKTTKNEEAYVWADKYRPSRLQDFLCNKEKAHWLRSMVTNWDDAEDQCDHFIFTGSPGVGKRTMLRALLREIFGEDKVQAREESKKIYLKGEAVDSIDVNLMVSPKHVEVNLCELKGYEKHVIEELIKGKHQTPYTTLWSKEENCKAVILHEADKLSIDALSYIKWMLEKFKGCNKVFFCGRDDKNLEVLKPICNHVELLKPSIDEILNVLVKIAKEENIQLPHELAQKIANNSKNNLRQAIRSFEATWHFSGRGASLREDENIKTGWEDKIAILAKNVMEEQSPKQLYYIRREIKNLIEHNVAPEFIYQTLKEELEKVLPDQMQKQFVHLYEEYKKDNVTKKDWLSEEQEEGFSETQPDQNKNVQKFMRIEEFIARFMSWYKGFGAKSIEV